MQNLAQNYGDNVDLMFKNKIQQLKKLNLSKRQDLALYAAYEIFLARDYICKEILPDYVIFIPKNLLTDARKKATINRFVTITGVKAFEDLNISVEDCSLGLCTYHAPSYDYTKPVFCNKDNNCVACDENISLVDAMAQLMVKGLLAHRFSSDILNVLFPKMNIYCIGHGGYSGMYGDVDITIDLIAGLFCNIGTSGQLSDFEKLLQTLNVNYSLQSLTLQTCFAGLHMNRFVSDVTKKPFFENLSYPVLFTSGLASMSMSGEPEIVFDVSSAQELRKCLYDVRGKILWGPEKINGDKGKYEMFFEYLNHTQTYQVKASKIQSAYSYTAYKPEYSKAIDVMMQLFNNQEVSLLSNLAFIRFPGTSWISTVELDKRIQIITPTQGLTAQSGISISQSVSLVLLSAPYVKYPIRIANRGSNASNLWIVPTIIDQAAVRLDEENSGAMVADPLDSQVETLSNQFDSGEIELSLFEQNYKGYINTVDYLIEEIDYPYKVADLGKIFFNKQLIKTSNLGFSILIKRLLCGSQKNSMKEYSDVVIWYQHNPLMHDEVVDGYTQHRTAIMFYSEQIGKMHEQQIRKIIYQDFSGSSAVKVVNVLSDKDREMYQLFVNQLSAQVPGLAKNATANALSEAFPSQEALPKNFEVLSENVPLPQKVAKLDVAFGKVAKRSAADVQKEQVRRQQKATEDQQQEEIYSAKKVETQIVKM